MEQTETPLSSSYSNLENIDKPFHSNVICTYIYFTSKFSLCNKKKNLSLGSICVAVVFTNFQSVIAEQVAGRARFSVRSGIRGKQRRIFAPLPFNFGNLCMCTKVFSSFATIAEVRFSIQIQKKRRILLPHFRKNVEFPNKVQVLKRLLHSCQLLHWKKGGRKKV